MENITISKGSYTVTIETDTVQEGYVKTLTAINPGKAIPLQSNGPSDTIIVDLLRIIRTFSVKGWITGTASKSATTVKTELQTIFNGGGVNGGYETMVYDGDSIQGIMEELTIGVERLANPTDFDSNPEKYQEVIKYEVSFKFVEGVPQGSISS